MSGTILNTLISIENYIKNNKKLFILSILLASISFGYELFNFSFSVDEELFSLRTAIENIEWIRNGRWGTYLFNIIFIHDAIVPFYPTLIAVIFIGLSATLFLYNSNVDDRGKIVFILLFVSFPIHSYYLSFNIYNAAVSVGVFLSVVSHVILRKSIEKNKKPTLISIIIASIILTFSFSIYQAIFAVFIILTFFYLYEQIVYKHEKNNVLFKKTLVFLMVYCISFLLYKLGDFTFKQALLSPKYFQQEHYLNHFLGWKNLPFVETAMNLMFHIRNYIAGLTPYGIGSIKTIFILIPILFFFIIKRVKNKKAKIITLLLLAGIIISPFALMIFLGSKIPPRSLLALPFLFAGIWYLCYQFTRNEIMKRLIFYAAIFIFSFHIYYNTRLFYVSNLVWKADRDMANRLVERIYDLEGPDWNKNVKIAFIGSHQPEKNNIFFRSSSIGFSFYLLENVTGRRILALWKTMNINGFKSLTTEEHKKAMKIAKTMPCWPHKKCVAYSDSIVVVKFGDSRFEKK